MPAARQWRIKSAALAARLFLHQDVSFEESWPGVIDATERRFGRLDVMVVNAGIGILCGAIEMSLADWRRQTAVNLHGVFLSVKYAVPAMRRAGGGSIIIMSSVAGLGGSPGVSGSIRFIPASSTRRSGRSYQCPPEPTHRSTRTRWPKPGCRSAGPGKGKILRTGCSSWPPTRPIT